MSAVSTGQTDVKVSICMITYNHEAFIAQAIEGVLMQKTDFSVELVIGEDCSTDHTRAIVQAYRERYPERIRLLLPDHNQGAQANFIATLEACCGQYIALCEGDDYWIDPFKLQKQVDFLETHSGYAISFHRIYQLVETTGEMKVSALENPSIKPTYDLHDVARRHFIPTASIVLRNGLVPELPSWFLDAPAGDWPLIILYAQHGKIGFIDESMAVHRVHSGGVWFGATKSAKFNMALRMFETIGAYLGPEYKTPIRAGISDLFLGMSTASADQGDLSDARAYFLKSINGCPLKIDISILDKLVLLGRLYALPVYRVLKRLQAGLRDGEQHMKERRAK